MRTGASGLRLRVVLLLAPVVFGACGKAGDVAPKMSALALIEQFAFVPQGRAPLSSSAIGGANQISIDEALLVGMYEVTRAELSAYIESAAVTPDPLLVQHIDRWAVSDDTLPATFVTRDEALGYARWAGVRLLSRTEWLFCAISPRALAYPWADSWQQGRANTLDLGLWPKAPTRVGTFEGGSTATHLYDMLGNAWEWVTDEVASAPGNADSATALGGSYLSYKREIQREGSFFAQALSAGERREDLGFRVCAPARDWLGAHVAELPGSAEVRARLRAVGRRWGSSAVLLLGELVIASPSAGARDSLEAILSGARE